MKLKSYSGHQTHTKGVVTFPYECQVNFHLVEMEDPTVLGLPSRVYLLQQQNLLKCPEEMVEKIYKQYSDLFQGLGCLPGEHTVAKNQRRARSNGEGRSNSKTERAY